jgi:hypothetical protein
MRRWFARAVLLTGCLSLVAPLQAQQDAMSEIYGQGVHRYFAGDYAGAELLLNEVQAAGSEDPRVHYFLGMCKVAQGGGVMAGLADFEAGAQAEAKSKTSYQVGLALTRIQGAARREIEKARLAARSQARQQQLLEQRTRAEAAAAGRTTAPAANAVPPATQNVPDPLTDGGLSGQATVDPVQPASPDTSNPFGDDPVTPAPTDPAAPAPATPAEGADPFATPAAEPAMEDPFATPNN